MPRSALLSCSVSRFSSGQLDGSPVAVWKGDVGKIIEWNEAHVRVLM
jgi:hypothetical protein